MKRSASSGLAQANRKTDEGADLNTEAGATEAAQSPGASNAPRRAHMIGNAHIDAVWLWQWPDGLQEVRATFDSALARMEEYPDFIFTCDSVAYLAFVEEVDPQDVRGHRPSYSRGSLAGRWRLVGGAGLQPALWGVARASGTLRSALSARSLRHRCHDRLQCRSVRSLRLNAPAAAKSGMDSYVFLRPESNEKELPGECFWWCASDGSRVLTYRIPHGYCSPGEELDGFLEHSLAKFPAHEPELMIFYGVGNHGGGPTRANIDSIHRIDREREDLDLVLSSPRAYFDSLAARGAELASYSGDLQHHAVGCYSAHSGIKAWNRRAETALARAERLATVTSTLLGTAYPREQLAEAWKLVLYNQFHDTLAGTAVASAYEESRDEYGRACSIAAGITNVAIQSLGAAVDIPAEADMIPVMVVNTCRGTLGDRRLELECVSTAEVEVTTLEGEAVACQRIQSEATVGGRHRRLVLSLEVPALGYRVCRVAPTATDQAAPGKFASSDFVLDNGLVRLEVNPATGWLSSLYDEVRELELLPAEPGHHAVVVEDLSDTWSHGVARYDKVIGAFRCTSVRRVEDGPVRSVLRVESSYERSTLVEDIILHAASRHVEVRARLDWHEKHRLLKLRFPSGLEAPQATYAIPYGFVERACDGHEEPAQAWVDVSGQLTDGRRAGLSVINDGKYGYDVFAGEIGLTAVRSPVYCWHDPRPLEPGTMYEYLDQGLQRFGSASCPTAETGGRRAPSASPRR